MKLLLVSLAALALLFAPRTAPASQDTAGPSLMVSTGCALCHSNAPRASALRDARGHGIAPFDLWQGTMMANSARDPLWRAVLSAEVAAVPSAARTIEATCLRCHAPMASEMGLDDHGTGSLLHALECEDDLGAMARDGVSCTICHGIDATNLGEEASFSGNFRLDTERRLYGPHRDPVPFPMQRHTTFTPTHGEHVMESALCGTCHTLETEVLDAKGHETGATFLEQAPYLEWRNSAFENESAEPGPMAATCQACHLPTDDGAGQALVTRIARNPGGRDFPFLEARQPVGRHVLVGGNTLVLGMLHDHREELGVSASADALQATIAATREQLRTRTASVAIETVSRAAGRLAFDVVVQNRTGHKLPSAHPTRRAWLRVLVRDAEGAVLFASGRTDDAGRLIDGAGRPLASEAAGGPIEPHRDVIRTADEVATYQAVMADSEGRPTHTLVRGAGWHVDDRLLPLGWDPEHPEAARTAPVGTDGDDDFVGGSDRVTFELDLPGTADVTIEAALVYQTLNARWADELFRFETPEVRRFERFWQAADRRGEVLAEAVRSTRD